MEDRQPTNRIGKVVCSAVLAVVLGAGVTFTSPISETTANMANLLMEDSSLGGTRGGTGAETATPTPDSCGAEREAESDEPDEAAARLIP